MSLPTTNDLQPVDELLTNMLVAYMQSDDRFVADRVFPGVPVTKDSGSYWIFTKKYWFTDEMQVRAPGQQYARTGFGVSTTTYSTLQYALSEPIADEDRANSQLPMDLEQAVIRHLGQKMLLRKEVQWAADFMKTSVWGTDDSNSTTDWDDNSSGDPVNDVLTAKRTISNNTGYDANALVVGYIVHQALIQHPDIIDRIKYTQSAGVVSVEGALASLLGIERYLVGKATYANINEAGTFAATSILDDDALVTYISPSPSVFNPGAGYTFHWAPGGGLGGIRPVFRDEANDADLIKAKMQWDQKVVATDMGYFFADVV